jgi:hypothetical protein
MFRIFGMFFHCFWNYFINKLCFDGLMVGLREEQQYVFDQARKYGFEVQLLEHDSPTKTCEEKVSILSTRFSSENWQGRCVKAIYGSVDDDICGFVFPMSKGSITTSDIKRFYAQIGTSSDEFYFSTDSSIVPASMEYGTCTPFVPVDEMKYIDHLFILDSSDLDGIATDCSIGGHGDEAQRKSMLISYDAIFTILKAQFDGKVHKVV